MEKRHVRVQSRGEMLEIEWSTADGTVLSSRTISREDVLHDPDTTLLGADADWPVHLQGTPIVVDIEDDALRDALDAQPKFRDRIEGPRTRVDAISGEAISLPSYRGTVGNRGFSNNSIDTFNTADAGGNNKPGKPPGWTDNG